MAFFCAGPCARPFADFNKLCLNGVPPGLLEQMPSSVADHQEFELADTGMDLNHYQKDWLGADAWFGPNSGRKLHKAFVYAMHAAGDRPVSGVWVHGVSVRASVIDHGDAIQVVVSSPRPDGFSDNNESPCAAPCGTVFPLHGKF